MAWRVLALTSTVDLPDGTPQAIDADAGLCVFTTADLRWQPVVSGDPDGAQIATLWGDPVDGAFGAVLRVRKNSADVYTLVRRRDADEPRHAFEAQTGVFALAILKNIAAPVDSADPGKLP
jgi:hypothetical protein